MTLVDTIRLLERTAASQPSVGMIVKNDIFRLNAAPDAKYGVFAWTQGQHRAAADDGLISYTFTLFYADRMTEDKSNETEIQSVGVQTLTNILRALADHGVSVGDYSFRTFNQRFLDECAGVFTTVTIGVPVLGLCGINIPIQ